jgi:hypothetical protein
VSLGFAPPATAETLTFKFKEPADADGWSSVTAKWKVKNKSYGPVVKSQEDPVTILDELNFDDLEVTYKLTGLGGDIIGGGGFLRGSVTMGTVLSGYLAIGTFFPDAGVVFSLYRLDDWNLVTNTGEVDGLCEEEVSDETNDGTFSFKAKGSRLKIFYKSELICSVTDNTYTDGQIGLYNEDAVPLPRYKSVEIVTPD